MASDPAIESLDTFEDGRLFCASTEQGAVIIDFKRQIGKEIPSNMYTLHSSLSG